MSGGRGHLVIRPCRYCTAPFSYTAMKVHASRCTKNPLATTCKYCGDRVNLRMGWFSHITSECRNRPEIPPKWKVCSACQDPIPLTKFALDARSHDGHHGRCKTCHNGHTTIKRQNPAEKLKHRRSNLRWRYKIPLDEYDRLFTEQAGRCAACGDPPGTGVKDKHLHVDHDHKTNKVRQLLCLACNHVAGKAKDSAARCFAVGNYLLRHHPELSQEVHLG